MAEVAEEVHNVAVKRVDAAGGDEGVDMHSAVVSLEEIPAAAAYNDLFGGLSDGVDSTQTTEPTPALAYSLMPKHETETYQIMSS